VPIIPLILHAWLGIPVVAAFLIGAILGVLITRPRELVRQLSRCGRQGSEDVGGGGDSDDRRWHAAQRDDLPTVRESLGPLISKVDFGSPLVYVLFFGLLSPLALYRGPLNPYGIGIGIYLPDSRFESDAAARASRGGDECGSASESCDPTNTQNVWIANFVGIRVEEADEADDPLQNGGLPAWADGRSPDLLSLIRQADLLVGVSE
jgi:hypothetical protein